MSSKKCCVPDCENEGGEQRVLHVFPNPEKDWQRFNKWVLSIGGDIVNLPNDFIYKYRRICHAHFEDKYCCRYDRISKIAVPTLKLPGILSIPQYSLIVPPMTRKRRFAETMASSSKDYTPELFSSIARKEDCNFLPKNIEVVSPLKEIQNFAENISSTSKGFAQEFCSQNAYLMKENIVASTSKDYTPVMFPSIAKKARKDDCNLPKNIEIASPFKQIENFAENIPSTSNDPSGKQPKRNETNSKMIKTIIPPRIRTKRVLKTVAEQELYEKILKLRVRLSKYKNKSKKQSASIKISKKIVSNPTFLNSLEDLPSAARILTSMQLREHKKMSKGRRFSFDDKILALTILKQSPKAYKFLRRILILPAPQTLQKLLQRANLSPGINEKVFMQLKRRVQKMKQEEQRLCVLLFDEMSLAANVSYNERKDRVTGFVNNGEFTTPEYADHAQLFLIRGLTKNYKQPVCYSFSAAATKGFELSRQIKSVIKGLQEAGLIVVATVCDQGTNNRQAIKLLVNEYRSGCLKEGREPSKSVFSVNGEIIFPLYDTPHMLKCIRNNLMTKNLEFTMNAQKKVAKWEHLELLLKENPGYQGIRLIPKLTDSHVLPHRIPKMKVKYASQVFSQTVAKNMGYLADKGILPGECRDTADLLLFFDKLFDSLNGSFNKKRHAKPLLGAVKENSIHHKVWNDSKKILKSMRFISKSSRKSEAVPSLTNWVWTLDNMEELLKKLKTDYNVTSVWMRHLNQDPIENYFGAIRSHGCRNTNPTAEKFESTYTTLLLNNMSSVHAVGSNCESDYCDSLHALLITDCDEASTTCVLDTIPEIELKDLNEKKDPRILGPLQYVSGYFVKKAQTKIFKNCKQCKNDLSTEKDIEYIKCREYTDGRWLTSPSEGLIGLVSNLQDVIYTILKENLHKQLLKEFMKTCILIHIDFNLISCQKHKEKLIEFLINLACRFFIYSHCKNINKILCGKRDCEDGSDSFAAKAKKMFIKNSKRKQ